MNNSGLADNVLRDVDIVPRQRALDFILRQIRELRSAPVKALLRNACTFFVKILPAALTVPLIFVVRTLRPVVIIRFGCLSIERIGAYTANVEIYLSETDSRLHGERTLDIFYNDSAFPYRSSRICNYQLKRMWERVLHVSFAARSLYLANRWLPGYEKHVIPMRKQGELDIHGVLADTRPHLSFTASEEKKGLEGIRKLGIPEKAGFVCFHSRDSAYLDSVLPEEKWRYQDHRDSDIQSYIPAAKELAARGYYAVRMGAVVKGALKVDEPKIIDYARKGRSDFLDIFLSARCKFFLGSAVGIPLVSMIFRRPVALVNFVPLSSAPTWSPYDLFIPKKMWLRNERRLMTFREVFKCGSDRFIRGEQFDRLGIELLENTPEEICDLTVEMEYRLKKTWRPDSEDEKLQQRFWSIFKEKNPHQACRARIGAKFLRQNMELLDLS